MADFYTKDELVRIYNALPDELHDVIFSPETFDTLNAVQKTYELNQQQREALSVCSGLVMMGILPPEMFVKAIIDQLELQREKASLIAQTINRDLFNPVKEYLELIHGIEEKKDSAPKAVSMPPPLPPRPLKPIMTVPPTQQKPASVPTVAPAVPPAPPGPIRSDWGWHGKKNEATGQMEFKRESIQLDAPPKASYQEQNSAGVPHVGSVFEQKLGGAFSMKNSSSSEPALGTVTRSSEVVQYTATPSPSPSVKPALHVPHKPTEVKIPPVEAMPPR